MRLVHAAFALAAALAMTSGAFAMGRMMGHTVHVTMSAQNNSKETGTATLTQKGKNLEVVVRLKNAPMAAQPAHIHAGTCANLNPAPKYPLSNVVDGKSTTMIKGVSLESLAGGKFAVNVHKSANDLKTYVSCGDIK
ncbi:MAG TPA: CHRD domain-containing protein [Candidatus Baltobacteraceae bacterium]|nr:CHRD domain-containing protein [Candidatus Baltobacteraceae bacterium]